VLIEGPDRTEVVRLEGLRADAPARELWERLRSHTRPDGVFALRGMFRAPKTDSFEFIRGVNDEAALLPLSRMHLLTDDGTLGLKLVELAPRRSFISTSASVFEPIEVVLRRAGRAEERITVEPSTTLGTFVRAHEPAATVAVVRGVPIPVADPALHAARAIPLVHFAVGAPWIVVELRRGDGAPSAPRGGAAAIDILDD
jgi:hypothetical protein